MLESLLSKRNIPPLTDSKLMLDTLLKEEYGYLPKHDSVSFETEKLPSVYKNLFGGNATLTKVNITCTFGDNTFTFPCEVYTPNKEGKHPFFVNIAFKTSPSSVYIPYEEIIDSGFGFAKVCYSDITSDDGDFSNGLAGVLYPNGKRAPTDAGKISMWAWAASRVLDYLYTLDCVDLDRVTVCGHSRLGKTALLAAACDTRFYCGYSNDSGCSGAAITRDKQGERVFDICKNFPFWFCENYYKYINNEDKMPFDQHWLIASIAPRKVYVASASEDIWADPDSEYLACVAASPAFKNGFVCDDRLPVIDDRFHKGDIGYHLRKGRHYMGREDWNSAISFLTK